MDKIKNFKELRIWNQGIEIVKGTYRLSKKFPRNEIYILASQMQRPAISIPSNIAEGFIRAHKKEFVQHLYVALGSCAELETQIIIAKELAYITDEETQNLTQKIYEEAKQIRALISKITKT
jgi:four helix bundle protein